MNTLITAHHFDLTPAIREYVENRLERITRHADQVVEIEVILAVEAQTAKDRQQGAEINLRLKGETLHAQSHAADLYAAIDAAVDKLDRQVTKSRGKVTDHRHDSPKRAVEPPTANE